MSAPHCSGQWPGYENLSMSKSSTGFRPLAPLRVITTALTEEAGLTSLPCMNSQLESAWPAHLAKEMVSWSTTLHPELASNPPSIAV